MRYLQLEPDGWRAGRAGGRDCDGTELSSGSYEVTTGPASTVFGAPPGGRQINSKDTQTAGSVVSKSQAA